MRFLVIFFLWQITTVGFLSFSLHRLVSQASKSSADRLRDILHYARVDSYYSLDSNIPPKTPSYDNLEDVRVLALRKFFKKYNSPLHEHAYDLVRQSDIWGLDYALLPAIAMQESSGCKRIPANSYNCWGFGIYGNKVARFASYSQAMAKVAKTIREAYINDKWRLFDPDKQIVYRDKKGEIVGIEYLLENLDIIKKQNTI